MTATVRIKWISLFIVTLFSLATQIGFVVLRDATRPVEADAVFYHSIAKSLADGNGYVDTENFWADTPSTGRMPGWPFVAAIGIKVFGDADSKAVMRIEDAVINTLSAIVVALIVFSLTTSNVAAAFGGIFFSLHPSGLYLADKAYTEPLYALCLLIAGLAFVYRKHYLGWFILGAGTLIRANLLIILPIAIVLNIVLQGNFKLRIFPNLKPLIICAVLFCILPALWMFRNYNLTAKFPVMSTLKGETFYGGNNTKVANDLQYWGYWVFPDEIPGETTKKELASTRSQTELDDYYFNRGKDFVKENLESYPRLLVGKLVRAFVPVPWVPKLTSYGGAVYRILLYFLFFLTLVKSWQKLEHSFSLYLISFAFVSLATVCIFYGSTRFSFPLEALMIPVMVVGLYEKLRKT